MKKLNLFLAVIILFVGFTDTKSQVIVGDPAPDFSYNDTDGVAFKLSDHRGEVVFMYLFGNSCPSCLAVGNKTETEINQLYSANPNFTAVGLDMWDNSSSVASVKSFKSQTGITYPLLVKAGGVAASFSTSYDRIIIVDQEGIIRHKNNSLVNQDIDNAKLVIEEFLMTASLEDELKGFASLKINAYPNPAQNNLNLGFNLNRDYEIQISIYNSLGHKIKSIDTKDYFAGKNTIEFDVSDINNGIYFYNFNFVGETSLSGKFLVKK